MGLGNSRCCASWALLCLGAHALVHVQGGVAGLCTVSCCRLYTGCPEVSALPASPR